LSAKKQRDFAKFKQIARLIQEGRHLSREGIDEILAIRRDMNDGGAMRRKYSDDSITELFEVRESSETARQAPGILLVDDTVRAAQPISRKDLQPPGWLNHQRLHVKPARPEW